MSVELPADGDVANRSDMVEEFLELLLADEELLRAEFEAIIADEWPGPPPSPPHRRVCGPPGHRAWRRHLAPTRVLRPERVAQETSPRQRSPPVVDRTEANLEGR
jgi:hypothetical protein